MAPRKNSKKSKQTSLPARPPMTPEMQDMLIGIIFLAIGILVFFSTEPLQTADLVNEQKLPVLGEIFRDIGTFLFGDYFRFIFSPILIILGALMLAKRNSWSPLKILGFFGFFISLSSLIGWYNPHYRAFFNIFSHAAQTLGAASSLILFIVIFFVSLYLIFHISYKKIFLKTRDHLASISLKIPNSDRNFPEETETISPKNKKFSDIKKTALERKLETVQVQIQNQNEKNSYKNTEMKEEKIEEKKFLWKFLQKDKNTKIVNITDNKGNILTKEKISEPPKTQTSLRGWKFPALSLLNAPKRQNPISRAEIEEKALIIQKTLLQFGIEVEMEDECVGPTVIQYRLRPAEGVKVSKIENLNKDLALALSAKSIRIEAPIPGMNLVGIEVPNDKRDMITIREVLEDKNFAKNTHDHLPIALWKDINGHYVVSDLHKMPHLLVAGQTGSGKSVGMNGIIMSLLYKKSPAELQMIMVDPKQVELGMYDGIPHLLTPVITSPDKALNALRWTVAEMERRYGMMKENRTKNIAEYNNRVEEKEKIPYIVFIIDELADLMMSGNKKEVETQISRIAQKWRAAGMHIIIATQRPSVNVITGLIKANIPSRIAFTVTSQVDSRTILDQMGAESLLGKWDMLYWANGAMYATRVQGMFVDTDEIDNVVRDIRLTPLPDDWEANIPSKDTISTGGADLGNFEWGVGLPSNFDEDPKIIEQAIEVVRSAGKCSTSMLQRHMGLGYGRAAKIVDIMEEMGIVWPANGSKPREVLN